MKPQEVIAFKIYIDKYDRNTTEAIIDSRTKNNASDLLIGITNFEFLINFLFSNNLLNHLEAAKHINQDIPNELEI